MRDMRGIEPKVGDLFAMPFSKGSMGYVRIGRITEVIDKSQKLRVDWLLHREYDPPERSLVQNVSNGMVLSDDFLDTLPARYPD